MKNFVRVIIPDFHGQHIDILARDACLADIKLLDPQELVYLGDGVDAGGTFSAHQRSYTNEMTESYTDDCRAANRFITMVQARAPRAEGREYYLEGNHEAHVERWATRNFLSHKDAVGFLDVYGPERTLELKKRGIRYYRRSEHYMGLSIPGAIRLGKCFFIHGIAASKHATYTHLVRFGANVVHGHTHRMQSCNERTVTSAGFGAWCPGTLAKLQPLYAHTAPTSWTHGYGVQFVAASGAFIHVNVPIHKGKSLLHALRAA
jgi:UDP-2,3-diacylglucosamine pyrophosphatase LpxH